MRWIVEFLCEFTGKWFTLASCNSEAAARHRANMQEALYAVETRIRTV